MGIVEVNAKQFVEGGPLVYENPYDDPSNWACPECSVSGDSVGGHSSMCVSQFFEYCGPQDTEHTGPTEATETVCLMIEEVPPFDPVAAQLDADSDGSEPMTEAEYNEYNGIS